MKYYTGKKCHRGHLGKRYKSTNQCVECVKLYKTKGVKVSLKLHPNDAKMIKALAAAMVSVRKLTNKK